MTVAHQSKKIATRIGSNALCILPIVIAASLWPAASVVAM
jgi:hypothetical protein